MGSHASMVQGFESSQSSCSPGRQLSVLGSHTSSPSQASLSSQMTGGVPGTQPVVLLQVSCPLQGSPSLHGEPGMQLPVLGSHVSSPLHGSPSSHGVGGRPGLHTLF